MMTLKDIAVKRSNHLISLPVYSENTGKFYGSFESFASQFLDNDQDLLLFKWEIIFYEGDHSYYMEIISLNNKDGKVTMSRIQNITESDTTSIMNFLKIHYQKMQQIWMPFSKQN